MRIFDNECHLLIPTRGMNMGHFFIAEFSTPKKKRCRKAHASSMCFSISIKNRVNLKRLILVSRLGALFLFFCFFVFCVQPARIKTCSILVIWYKRSLRYFYGMCSQRPQKDRGIFVSQQVPTGASFLKQCGKDLYINSERL